jgi:hypothetical protein
MIPQVSITDKVIDFIEKSNQISENVGDHSDLLTDEKDILILSVNEIIVSMNEIDFRIGDLESLVTTEKGTLVGGINELRGTNYSTFGAVESYYDLEVQRFDGEIDNNDDYIIYTNDLIGSLGSLETTDKSSIVNSLNELDLTSSVVFKIEDYPDLGIEQFMGFLNASNFIGLDKENFLKYPARPGEVLFGDLDGSRYWGEITGVSDYALAEYDYNVALSDRDEIFANIVALQNDESDLNDNISAVGARVPYPIDTLVGTTVGTTTVIDASLGDSFAVTLDRNTTLSYINFNSGRSITMYIAYGDLYTLTWPANTYFPKGIIPTPARAERVSVQKYSTVYFTTKDTIYF